MLNTESVWFSILPDHRHLLLPSLGMPWITCPFTPARNASAFLTFVFSLPSTSNHSPSPVFLSPKLLCCLFPPLLFCSFGLLPFLTWTIETASLLISLSPVSHQIILLICRSKPVVSLLRSLWWEPISCNSGFQICF